MLWKLNDGRSAATGVLRPMWCSGLWMLSCREPYVIFSGGMVYEKSGQTPTITVIRGSSTTVLEMEHPVVDFVTICSTPWNHGRSCDLCCSVWITVIPLIYTDRMYLWLSLSTHYYGYTNTDTVQGTNDTAIWWIPWYRYFYALYYTSTKLDIAVKVDG